VKYLLARLLFTPSFLLAQSRFDGTWVMKMDTLRFSGTPEKYLFEKDMYHGLSCVPKVDVKTDGTEQQETGHDYDTLAANPEWQFDRVHNEESGEDYVRVYRGRVTGRADDDGRVH
jgi:hypothetical protein